MIKPYHHKLAFYISSRIDKTWRFNLKSIVVNLITVLTSCRLLMAAASLSFLHWPVYFKYDLLLQCFHQSNYDPLVYFFLSSLFCYNLLLSYYLVFKAEPTLWSKYLNDLVIENWNQFYNINSTLILSFEMLRKNKTQVLKMINYLMRSLWSGAIQFQDRLKVFSRLDRRTRARLVMVTFAIDASMNFVYLMISMSLCDLPTMSFSLN